MPIVSVKIPQEEADALEALNYEVNARKQIIAFFIDQGMDTTSEQFKGYQKEYVDFFVRWERAKVEMEATYLSAYPNRRRWWLVGAAAEVKLELVDA